MCLKWKHCCHFIWIDIQIGGVSFGNRYSIEQLKTFLFIDNIIIMHSSYIVNKDTLFFSYKDQQKKSQAGKDIEIATNKLTTMSLNIGYF